MLASFSPASTLATPKRQMVPATMTSPGDPSLASTPPMPLPGGILQLSPDSPGAFWGDSVASSPSTDAALQRQRSSNLLARTRDRLASPLWSPRPQTAPRTLARPIAEGVTEGSSSSAAIPSSANANDLQQLMSRDDVPENKHLLEALDAAPPQKQRPWIAKAVEWFDGQSIATLSPAAIRDYAVLAHIKVTPENRELLGRYFHSLCNKVEERSGGELLIQALAYALAHLDPAIFAGDPTPLLDLGTNLLAKLNPSQREFKQADYPSARASLEALFQTLSLAKEVAPRFLNVREGGLYQSFRSRLQEIIDRAQYYPVIYHAGLIRQTLHLLEDPQIDFGGNLRRLGQGLQGMASLYQGGRGLFTFNLRIDKLVEGLHLLQQAAHGQRIDSRPWYDQLLLLEGNMLHCLQQQDLSSYPDPGSLEKLVQNMRMSGLNLNRMVPGKVQQYQRALRFGIAMQLQILVLEGPNPEVRTGSIERIIALTRPEAWGSDPDVMSGLLDTLALAASQSHSSRSTEVAMAIKALEALAPQLSAVTSGQSVMLGGLLRSQSTQDAASRAFSAWLGKETLSAKLQRLREQTTQRTPSDEERLFSHVKRTLRQIATIESFRVQEITSLSQLSSYIALTKLKHFVERTTTTQQLTAILQEQGVCVLNGFGGAGKSTLAAHYGHARKETQTVRWIGAEDSFKLQEGYEQLAQELRVDHKSLAKKLLASDPSQYRQELARMVYNALARNNQPPLLILDNAEDASLIEDYLLPRPDAIQAIITTRSAEAFEGTYEQLQLSAFSQDEGQHYLEARLKAMKRPCTNPEVASLLEEVGLVPQKLNLAAGYLQANKMATTAQYIARLQALKQAGTKQQGKLTLPEVALGLEKLTKEGQQLMQYAAYLDADFIPRSLASALLGTDDPEHLSEVVSDLSRLSLVQVVYNGDQELGLQVHREVQAACREYDSWSAESGLASREAILSQLAQELARQMPWVTATPDERWQSAKLYAPHVAKGVSRSGSPDAQPSPVVARLLGCMGQYSKEVALNYSEALQYQKQALKTYQTLHKGDHPDVARALSEIGTTLSQAGQRQAALARKKQALKMRKGLAEGQDDPEVAHALNSVGELLTHLGRHQEALEYKQEGLEMRKRLFKGQDHPELARSLSSVGISLENLNQLQEALVDKQEGLEMQQRFYNYEDHPGIAHSLNNVGETLIKLGGAEDGIPYCEEGLAMRKRLFEGQDRPYIAQSLNSLGVGYTALERYQEAADHYQQAVEVALRAFKGAHPQLTQYYGHLIETLPKLEETQVQQIKATLVPLCSEVLGAEHALTQVLLAASTDS